MEIDKLKKLLTRFGSNVIFNQNLKKKNWFNIGGEAKVFFKANNLKDLVDFLKTINNQEKISIIGAGSNILIPDSLFDGIVIKLSKNFNNILEKNGFIDIEDKPQTLGVASIYCAFKA